ncbi:hypothetical protein NZD88_07400 [Chryseobacterium antibioticum]|uniref:Right handed beta helix domain-containing protein n=1 Tax=Chryseobacterium pyrolae TaxID=2987481 RepID=A0ABT2IFE9_9FLAO|nr:hypothetical protein [Chryseobacterium pyrolae]MCT2407366.1 hypothetical protein [Chryseobacterium pyrolae]
MAVLLHENGKEGIYKDTTDWADGTVMQDSLADGFFYLKLGDKYFENVETCVKLTTFGGDKKGILDSSAALQRAIKFCIDAKKDLIIDGNFRIDNTINIDRIVDGIKSRNWFKIIGGELKTSNNIPLFSSSLANEIEIKDSQGNVINIRYQPISQLIKFIGVNFTSNVENSFVFDDNKFLRCSFVGCSFVGIKMLEANDDYLQTLYFQSCNIRDWKGTWLKANKGCYDIRFNQVMAEQGESFIEAYEYPGLDKVQLFVQSSVIEGLSGFGVNFKGSSILNVRDCYFEGNKKGDIITDNPNIIVADEGVNIVDNFFGPSGDNSIDNTGIGYYHVVLNELFSGCIRGNNCPDGNKNLIFFKSIKCNVEYGQNVGDSNINYHSKRARYFYGNIVPTAGHNGEVVFFDEDIAVGSVIWNTASNKDNNWIGAICIERGTYATAKWKKFGTYTSPVTISKNYIDGSENLNSYTETGIFFVTLPSDFTPGVNYPVNEIGMLEVYDSEDSATGNIHQEYTTIISNKKYVRSYYGYGGVWSDWELINRKAEKLTSNIPSIPSDNYDKQDLIATNARLEDLIKKLNASGILKS